MLSIKKLTSIFIATFIFIFGMETAIAQEFNASISINAPALRQTDPKVFRTLEAALNEFMNSQVFTDDVFLPEERIQVSFSLTIREEVSDTRFKGEMAISAARPIFNSNQSTTLFNFFDRDLVIDYQEFNPIQFAENTFTDNTVAMFAYYAYYILGLDYDSYSQLGGDEYFQKAQAIVNTIPASAYDTYTGWRSADGSRARFFLIENMLNPRMRPFREANYEYHRLGLDLMHEDADLAKQNMLSALEKVDQVNRTYPNALAMYAFAFSKSDEIVEIFKRSTLQQKRRVQQIMVRLDPQNATKYEVLRA